jgi:hypothetical protein
MLNKLLTLFQGSCVGFREVLQTYNRITPDIKLFRPTNFAPLIRKAMNIVKQSKKVSILPNSLSHKRSETDCLTNVVKQFVSQTQ